jgi:acyl-CoA thioesterase-2
MTRAVDPPRPGTVIDEKPPFQCSWMRAARLPDDPRIHQAALAYTSDFALLSTSVQPHPITWDMPGQQNASLDHAVWFHRPFDFNQWHLHDMDSPSAAGERGFARGSIYDRQGRLVASTAQEGMIRIRPPKPQQA